MRISRPVGIFEAVNILTSEPLADEWVRLANANRIFRGSTPLAFMPVVGVRAMPTVRRLPDARRGGV